MPLDRRQIIALSTAIRERREHLAAEIAQDARLTDEIEAADTDRDVAELRELEAAGDRLLEGSYGKCTECAADIDPERLFARPGAEHCIGCQERFEKAHAITGGARL